MAKVNAKNFPKRTVEEWEKEYAELGQQAFFHKYGIERKSDLKRLLLQSGTFQTYSEQLREKFKQDRLENFNYEEQRKPFPNDKK